MKPTFSPLGDSALTITFGNLINEHTNEQVISAFRFLKSQNIVWVKDLIPAYASLSIVYDALLIHELYKVSPYKYVHEFISLQIENITGKSFQKHRSIEIPVCYHQDFAKDLIEISRYKNLSPGAAIEMHHSNKYKVYMIGFLPGFAYMGKVDERIAMPRKATPDLRIPAGSVGIAGEQTGIYPLDSPGGWNIIGQTPLRLFDPHAASPCLLQPGDEVVFRPVTLEEFFELKQQA